MKFSLIYLALVYIIFGCQNPTQMSKRDKQTKRGELNPKSQINDEPTDQEKAKYFGVPVNRQKAARWHRYRALEQGLVQGLKLSKDEVCQELGELNCVDRVFLSFLGGNDPIEQGISDRPHSPSLLTPIALERILISACQTRLNKDSRGNGEVFKYLGLGGGTKDLTKQVEELYKRLHGRLPSSEESELAVKAVGSRSAADAGLFLCVAIGTTVETVFN